MSSNLWDMKRENEGKKNEMTKITETINMERVERSHFNNETEREKKKTYIYDGKEIYMMNLTWFLQILLQLG